MKKCCFIPVLLFIAVVGTSCDPIDYSFAYRFWAVLPDGTVEPIGGGCSDLGQGEITNRGGFNIGVDGPDISLKIDSDNDSATVTIRVRRYEQLKRTYNKSFIKSSETDVYSFPTSDGTVFYFEFWGTDDCDGVEPSDIDASPYPSDMTTDTATSSINNGTTDPDAGVSYPTDTQKPADSSNTDSDTASSQTAADASVETDTVSTDSATTAPSTDSNLPADGGSSDSDTPSSGTDSSDPTDTVETDSDTLISPLDSDSDTTADAGIADGGNDVDGGTSQS